jgi:hypothetical protein
MQITKVDLQNQVVGLNLVVKVSRIIGSILQFYSLTSI